MPQQGNNHLGNRMSRLTQGWRFMPQPQVQTAAFETAQTRWQWQLSSLPVQKGVHPFLSVGTLAGWNSLGVKFFQPTYLPFFIYIYIFPSFFSFNRATLSVCHVNFKQGELMLNAEKFRKNKRCSFMSNFNSMHKLRADRLKQTNQFFFPTFPQPPKEATTSVSETNLPSSIHTYINNRATTTVWNKHRWWVAWVHALTSEISSS